MFDPWGHVATEHTDSPSRLGWKGFLQAPLLPLFGWPTTVAFIVCSLIGYTNAVGLWLGPPLTQNHLSVIVLVVGPLCLKQPFVPSKTYRLYLPSRRVHEFSAPFERQTYRQYIVMGLALFVSSGLAYYLPDHLSRWFLGLATSLLPLVCTASYRLKTGIVYKQRIVTNYEQSRDKAGEYSKYVIKRWIARCLDGILCGALGHYLYYVSLPSLVGCLWLLGVDARSLPTSAIYLGYIVVVCILYEAVSVRIWKRTLGKWIFNLHIVRSDTGTPPGWNSTLRRTLTITGVPFLIGVLGLEVFHFDNFTFVVLGSMFLLFTAGHLHPSKQGVQDIVAKTLVTGTVK